MESQTGALSRLEEKITELSVLIQIEDIENEWANNFIEGMNEKLVRFLNSPKSTHESWQFSLSEKQIDKINELHKRYIDKK